MNNTQPFTQEDFAKTNKIRNQYIRRENNKIEQLKRVDKKVKMPGRVFATFLGTTGALVMGAGMSEIMVWNNMEIGLKMGIPGLIITLFAPFVYFMITGMRKKKFTAEILNISDEIIADKQNSYVEVE